MLFALVATALLWQSPDVSEAFDRLSAPDQKSVLAAVDSLAKSGPGGLNALVSATRHESPYVRTVAWAKLGELGPAAASKFHELFVAVRESAAPGGLFLKEDLLGMTMGGQMLASTVLKADADKDGKPAPSTLRAVDDGVQRGLRLLALGAVGSDDFAMWERELGAADDLEAGSAAAFGDARMALWFAAIKLAGEGKLPATAGTRFVEWIKSENLGLRVSGLAMLAIRSDGVDPSVHMPALRRSLEASAPAERVIAVSAVGSFAKKEDAPALLEARLSDQDALVRLMAAHEMRSSSTPSEKRVTVVLAGLSEKDVNLRRLALEALDPSAGPIVPGESKQPAAPVELALPKLRGLLKDESPLVRASAVKLIGAYGAAAAGAIDDVRALTSDDDRSVARAAKRAVDNVEKAHSPAATSKPRSRPKLDDLPLVPELVEALAPASSEAAVTASASTDKATVLSALAYLAQRKDLAALEKAMRDERSFTSCAALLTIGGLGQDATPMIQALFERHSEVEWAEFAHHTDGLLELSSLTKQLRKAVLVVESDGSKAPAELGWDTDYALRVAAYDAMWRVGSFDPAAFAAEFQRIPETDEPALVSFDDRRIALAQAASEQHEAWCKVIPDWLASEDVRRRLCALDALGNAWRQVSGKRPPEPVVEAMRKSLASTFAGERARAAMSFELLNVPREQVKAWLTPLLEDRDPLVRLAAARTLRTWVAADAAAEPVIVATLSDPEPRLRRAAIQSFSSVMASLMRLDGQPPKSALPRLIEMLADENADVRYAVLSALPDYGAAALPAREKIQALIATERVKWVRDQAEQTLAHLAELESK